MAEAAVEMPVSRYFCHQCTQEISPVLPDYVCPRCQGGFIECLEPSEGARAAAGGESDEELYSEASYPEILSAVMADLMRSYGPDIQFRREAGSAEGPPRSGDANSSSEPSTSSADNRPFMPYSYDLRLRQQPSRVRRRRRPMLPEEVIQMMLTVTSRASNVPNSGVPILLNLHGNPGDYAWGRGGLDAVITQLLNQLDGTGPPPLPKEKIDEIPDVQIVQEQVDIALQCTVCMEDFRVGENVKRLSCQHHFHEDCIIPWLKLHGTCPICRKLLNEDSTLEDSEMNYDVFSSVSGAAGSSTSACPTSTSGGSFSTNGEASSHLRGHGASSLLSFNLSPPPPQSSSATSESGATASNPTNTSVYEFTDECD